MNTCFHTLDLPEVLRGVIREYACFELHYMTQCSTTKCTAFLVPNLNATAVITQTETTENATWIYDMPHKANFKNWMRVTPNGGVVEAGWWFGQYRISLFDSCGNLILFHDIDDDEEFTASSTHIFVRRPLGTVIAFSKQSENIIFKCDATFKRFIAANDKYLIWQDKMNVMNCFILPGTNETTQIRVPYGDWALAEFGSFDSNLLCLWKQTELRIVNVSSCDTIATWQMPKFVPGIFLGFR